ncbi:Mycobacterium numidiamassiliense ORFan [Mycobacterium numidiamassiliense]|uniref:Mycobacterium numidiamassiliense ORFan n=1 Tax=Mycobacterium numidiamassiliense TaxID=1841861 RepID=A0A2U3PII9_9MYCO|nr:Mycobacterium numidiamassiliense ORFan [Mycobacterium numidiamassiliense]
MRVPRSRQWVIVRDDPNGHRSYWASLRMRWPDDIDTERYWQSALSDAHTYKTKVATKRHCPNRVLRAPNIRLMTFSDAQKDEDNHDPRN